MIRRVALIPGDGIGVEVVREARRLLEALNASESLGLELVDWDLGAERYLREGITITDEEFAALAEYDAGLLVQGEILRGLTSEPVNSEGGGGG